MDREAWWAAVHKVAESWTQLSTHIFYWVFFASVFLSLLVASTLSYSLGTREQLTQICAHPCLKTDPSDGMYLGLLESSLSDTPPGVVRLCGAGTGILFLLPLWSSFA